MARTGIFIDKDPATRVQGILTKVGGKEFEKARQALKALYTMVFGHPPTVVSDADTIEYLARGRDQTRTYLEAFLK